MGKKLLSFANQLCGDSSLLKTGLTNAWVGRFTEGVN